MHSLWIYRIGIPFGFLLISFGVLGVNIPYLDEWNVWVGHLDPLSGPITWESLWERFYPHYMVLTRFFLKLYTQFEWGPKSLMWTHVWAWLGMLFLFWKIGGNDPRLTRSLGKGSVLLVSLFLISFCQRGNFFVSWNVHFVFAIFSAYLFCYFLLKDRIVGMTFAFFLSFLSFSTWVCLVPLFLLWQNKKDPWWGGKKSWVGFLFALIFAGGTILFLYLGPEAQETQGALSRTPLYYTFLFYLRVLGSPFLMVGGPYQNLFFHVIGIGFGVIYLFLFGFCFLKNQKLKSPFSIALFGLPLFGLVAVGLLTAGRTGSLDYAGAASRFTSFSIPGWAVLFLMTRYFLPKKWVKGFSGVFLGLAFICNGINFYAEGWIRAPKLKHAQTHLQGALKAGKIPDSFYSSLHKFHQDPVMMKRIFRKMENEPDRYWFLVK